MGKELREFPFAILFAGILLGCGLILMLGRRAFAAQEPLRSVAAKIEGSRFQVREYIKGVLTLYVINDLEGEGCWLLVESSRGMAVASTDLGVCYDTERE